MTPRLAVNLYFFANGLIYASWASRIPDIMEYYNIDNSQIGFVLLAHSIGALLAMPLTGWLIYKNSSKQVTFLSGIFFTVIFALSMFASSYYLLLIPFFIMGSATGIMDVAMNAQAVEVEKAYKKPIMTFFHAVFSIGMVIGGFIGSYFITKDIALTTHFLIVAAIAFSIILLCRSAMIEDANFEYDSKGKVFVWPKGTVLGLGIIAFCCMMGEGAMTDWSTNFMKNIIAAPDHTIAYGLTGFAAAMTLGRLFGDRGRAHFGDYKILFGCTIFSLIGIVLIIISQSYVVAILGFALVGLGLSNIVPVAFSIAGSLKGVPAGVGISMVTTIGYTGFMFGPPIIGWVADYSDLRMALGLLLGLFIIMFFIIIAYRNKIA